MNTIDKQHCTIDISPSFLCDADGNILLTNAKAEESSLASLIKTNITEYISSADALRYDITMNSKKPRPFIAAAKLVCGKRFLAIIPNSMPDCRIAAVAVEKSVNAARKKISSGEFFSVDDIRLICQRLEDIGIILGKEHRNELFDAGKAIRRITDKITNAGASRLSFNMISECCADNFMCNCGLEGFVSVMVAIIFALDKISASGAVDISVDGSSLSRRIVVETEFDEGCTQINSSAKEIMDFPCLDPEFLGFAAECSDCTLDISIENSKLRITTVFSDISENIDFKSNDPFANLGSILERSISAIQAIYKEEGQE